MKLRRIIGTTLFYLLVAFIVVYTVFPFYWAIVSSLKEGSALYQIEFFPKDPKWGNYAAIFREQPFGRNILNSVIVAVTVVSISLVLSVTASYALKSIEFRGRTPLLLLVLSVSMFPQVAVLSGMFELVSWLGIYDTLWSLTLSYMILTLPFTTWVLAFISAWNEFLFAITFTLSNERRTVPVAIALISGASRFELPWGRVMAASVIVTVPLVLLVLIFQRRIVSGLTAGAVKG